MRLTATLLALALASPALAADPDTEARVALALAGARTVSAALPPGVPPGSVPVKPGLFRMPDGGCIWGTFPSVYAESLRTGRPLLVHIGRRLLGMCHAASADGWLHTLLPEFQGRRDGVAVCLPHDGTLYLTRHFPGTPPVSAVLAEGRRPVTQSFLSGPAMAPVHFAPPMRMPMTFRGGRRGGGSC